MAGRVFSLMLEIPNIPRFRSRFPNPRGIRECSVSSNGSANLCGDRPLSLELDLEKLLERSLVRPFGMSPDPGALAEQLFR
jgi:hypothetical protein